MPTILIVDDEKSIRKIMLKMMSEYGECETVESGVEAVVKFKEFREKGNKFDLIILDHALEDITGLEVLKKIRSIENKAGIKVKNGVKVIMVTSNKSVENVKACITAGCNHYILKPVKPKEMKERLVHCEFIEGEPKSNNTENDKN